jgi:hypothetical protein
MLFFSRTNTLLLVAVATSFFVANVQAKECCPSTTGGLFCVGDACKYNTSCLNAEQGFQLICNAAKQNDSGTFIKRSVDPSVLKENDGDNVDDVADAVVAVDTDESSSAGIISISTAASSFLLAVIGVAAIAGL